MAILALNSARDYGILLVAAAAIYLVSMLLGVGLSSYTTFFACSKTNTSTHFTQGALWALYPTVAYLIFRSFEFLRVYFDRFFMGFDSSDAGKLRAGWISIGYCMMLGGVMGMFGLMDSSIQEVCIPSIDEANRFKAYMLDLQAKKAAALESTPAVTSETPQDTTQ